MAKALMVFLFLTSFWGCHAQVTVTQPPSVSASIGKTVNIFCTLNGDSIRSDDTFWYQHKPGNAPIALLCHGTSRAPGVSTRFSGFHDSSANASVLIISNVQAGDEADYHCYYFYSINKRIFGGGTQLTVSGGPRSPPTVNLYCPPKEQMASEGKATLVCSITDFSPSPMETTWEVGGTAVSNGVQTTKPIKDNGKYMTSSYMTTTASDWERGDSFTCKVRHEGIDYVKTVSQSQCP